MTRWLRLWPSVLSAILVVAALAVSVRPAPAPAPAPARAPAVPPSLAPRPGMGGIVAGIPRGGIEQGMLPGADDRRVFHHSDLTVLHRVDPTFPQAAIDADLPDARCLVKSLIGSDGVPTEVRAENCDEPFVAASEAALLQWRWAPPLDERGRPVAAQTTIAVNFRLAREGSADAPR